MEAFEPQPPQWTETATHATHFCCPTCRNSSLSATHAWLNRRSPVYTEDHRRKWQEFYQCECGTAWWAWSDQRPPSEYSKGDRNPDES